MVQHFFSVSYDWETQEVMHAKARLRDRLVQAYREREELAEMTAQQV